MKKKIITFFCLLFITAGCGYNSIYSSNQNYAFNITNFELSGDRKINLRIKNNLENISNYKSPNEYILKIKATKDKTAATKDSKGDTKIYNLIVSVEVKVFVDEKLLNKKIFKETFNYSNNSNKYELKQYEKNILNNLNDKIIDNIIIYLLSF